jgi:hypothetical protein
MLPYQIRFDLLTGAVRPLALASAPAEVQKVEPEAPAALLA